MPLIITPLALFLPPKSMPHWNCQKVKKINIIAPTTPNLSGLKTIRALANNWKEIINTALNLGAGNRNLLNTLTALSKDKENSIADTQKMM
ncbi:hypothetical protein P4055_08500 [Pseudomonas aeruginosa]|nr:hypothetical protein [Pseudomonas aeruginosa]